MSTREEYVSPRTRVAAPRLGRRLLRWISAFALLALLATGAYALRVWEPRQLPVRVVTVDGEVEHLSPRQLQQTVMDHLRGGIVTQDLADLKAAVEAMPWIRSASLRRQWPDRLEIAVEEQVALARWGEDGLVTADAVVFRPGDGVFPPGLKTLAGPDARASDVVARFRDWSAKLAGLQLEIEDLSLDARGAWTLRCSEGFTLALGKAQVQERLSRFLRAYPKLVAAGTPSIVDMRYSNGLAVRWAEEGSNGPRISIKEAAKSAQLNPRPKGPSRS